MANEQSNPQAKPQPQRIPLAKIHDLPGVFFPKQPDKSYGGLVTSIQANGVKEAVILRLREDGEYQLVEGYRRRRASELAKKQDIPAYVYEMTMPEAIAYRKQVKTQANAPIPGKLVETPAKAPDAPTKSGPAPVAGEKPKEQTAPGEKPKEAEKPTDPVKAVVPPAKEERPTVAAAAPAVPGKDDKAKSATPKTEDKPEKSAVPGEKAKDGDKPSDPAKAVAPATKEEKPTVAAAGPGKDDKDKTTAPKAGDKPEKSAAPADKAKDGDKPDDPAKAVVPPAKEEKLTVAAAAPATPGKDDNDKTPRPKTEDKPEKSAAPADKAKDGDKPTATAAAPATPGKDDKDKTPGPKTEDKPEKSTVPSEKAKDGDKPGDPAKAVVPPAKEEKPTVAAAGPAGKSAPATVTGPAAAGPPGTAITQIFDQRLTPPDEKALKSLPVPKEGESFFITLHPAYLEKSKFNTFSVDTNSENFKELMKSVELVGIKDPVLTRINPEGGLEILSGQRRHLAASELNYPVPAIIQKIDDADAKIIVADGNLHRDKISSYDLSRALRMKMEGMKQKSGRRRKGEIKAEEMDSDEKLAKEMGMSVSKLNRILRLSEATKDVCDRVDDGSLEISIASAISFLKPKNQDEVLYLSDMGYKLSNKRVERMKKVEKSGKLDQKMMRDILEDKDIAPKQTVPPAPAPAAPATSTTTPTTAPSTAPTASVPTASAAPAATTIPASPDVKTATPPANEPAQAAPTAAAPAPASSAGDKAPEKDNDIFKGAQERPESTKVILAGDRLRRYFPDVTMTPREIEESVYEALEERRQRQEKLKQKNEIFKRNSPTR